MEPQVPPPPTTVSLSFAVHRKQPELISPAKPTPREIKLLSDLDDQQGLRFHISTIFFYKQNSITNSDPVLVIRRALAETLVYYYPFAGRLREGLNRKLAVDCTGEGVLFIEADADVALVEFEVDKVICPPFPCFEELLFDVEGSSEILNTPLILIQVTRLKCGGFIFALRLNHTMADAVGLYLFLKTLTSLARGSHAPSIIPVWDRHLLNARIPPHVTHVHREYEQGTAIKRDNIEEKEERLVSRSFFFGKSEISAIRKLLLLNNNNSNSSDLETLTAFLWRYRTIALNPNPNKQMRLLLIVNARSKLKNPPLPIGYYGNALAFPVAIATAKELIENPLEFAVKLIKEVKSSVTEEYIRSLCDFTATRGRPSFITDTTYLVSDLRSSGFGEIDFENWGKPVYAGIAMGYIEGTFYNRFEKRDGEIGIIVPVCLPVKAMERFVKEVNGVLTGGNCDKIMSSL